MTENDKVIVALNMVPVPLEKYKIPVDEPGKYKISLNTDDMSFGGSGYPTGSNEEGVFPTEEGQWKGRQFYISVCLPPLSGMYIEKLAEPEAVTAIDTEMDTVTGKDL
jgi:1,4-alpha-glucan branching enzyme